MGNLMYPIIGIDSKDKIYVVDRENHRIQEFNTNGTFIAKGGNGRGSSDNQMNRPERRKFLLASSALLAAPLTSFARATEKVRWIG